MCLSISLYMHISIPLQIFSTIALLALLTHDATDIFLPSYMDYESSDLEHRPDPVQEIVLTDEEAASIFPQ